MAREVTITVTGKLPLDAVKAVADQVQIAERTFERMGVYEATKNKHGLKDVTAKSLLKTGATVFLVHKFTYTLVAATGEYTFAYVGTYPNPKSKPAGEAVGE